MSLSEAEEKGHIIRLDKLPSKVNSSKEDLAYKEGLIQRKHPLTMEVAKIQELTTALNEEKSSQALISQARPQVMSTLFKKAGYIYNPLRKSFPKTVLIHMLAFRFLTRAMMKAMSSQIIMKDVSKAKRWENILSKWTKRISNPTAFSLHCQLDHSKVKLEVKTEMSLREIRNKIQTYESVNRTKDSSIHSANLKIWNSLLLKIIEDIRNNKDGNYPKNIENLTELIHSIEKALDQQKAYTLCHSLKSSSNSTEQFSPHQSWNKYPGMHKCIQHLKYLKSLPANSSLWDLLEVAAATINCVKYCEAYVNQSRTQAIVNELITELNTFILILKENSGLYQALIDAVKTFSTNTIIVDQVSDRVLELANWLTTGGTIPKNTLKCGKLLKKTEPYQPFNRLSEMIDNPIEFVKMQEMTFEYFHRILSTEIKESWPRSKIEKYCIEDKDGKLYANWRIRAGWEAVNTVTQGLSRDNPNIKLVDFPWSPVIPVGHLESPLVNSLCLYIHYHGSPNLLQRPKLFQHRGTNFNRDKLWETVYVPNALKRFEEISENCMSCQVRLQRHFQSIIGPLAPSTFSWSPFVTLQIDTFGPVRVKLLHSSRETRFKQHTKMHILVGVCPSTKFTVLELLEDLSAPSIAAGLSKISCQHQLPTIIYADRHQSNIHVLANADLHLQVNHILMRTKGFQYHLAPTGLHHQQGEPYLSS